MERDVTQDDLNEIEEICYNDGYEIDDIQDAMTVLADDLVKEMSHDYEPDILKGVKFIEYQIKFKQDNNEYDIDTPVEPIDTGMPEDCSFYEAKKFLNSKGYILVEVYDANRERAYKKYGAETDAKKKDIDFRLDMKAYQDNNEYVRNKYNALEIENRKSAVPVVEKMVNYIEKKYKVDIWSYDDGYYNPVSGAHYAPKENYKVIKFACGPNIGREWRIYWYVKPERQETPIADTDKAIAVMPRDTYNRYTGKFVVHGWADTPSDKRYNFNKVLAEEDIINFVDEVIAEVKKG